MAGPYTAPDGLVLDEHGEARLGVAREALASVPADAVLDEAFLDKLWHDLGVTGEGVRRHLLASLRVRRIGQRDVVWRGSAFWRLVDEDFLSAPKCVQQADGDPHARAARPRQTACLRVDFAGNPPGASSGELICTRYCWFARGKRSRADWVRPAQPSR
jgi:hypothetical protein